jgi:hypothetical protein
VFPFLKPQPREIVMLSAGALSVLLFGRFV